MDDFITIREASNLTGKAEITIRRLIRGLVEKEPETAQVIKEQTPAGFTYRIKRDFIIERVKSLPPYPPNQPANHLPTQGATQPDQVSNYSSDDLTNQRATQPDVLSNQPPIQGDDLTNQPSNQGGYQGATQTYNLTNQSIAHQDNLTGLLVSTVEMLKGQLVVKDNQIDSLGRQIDELILRDRETNILLKGFSDRLFLLETNNPKQPPGTEQVNSGA